MEKNLEEKQLNYLLSLSKKNPNQLLYLLNLNYPTIAVKHEDFLSTKNRFLTILDLTNEPRHMHTEIVYIKRDPLNGI